MFSEYPKSVEASGRLRLLSFRPNIPEIPGGVANVKAIFRNVISELKEEREVNMYRKWKEKIKKPKSSKSKTYRRKSRRENRDKSSHASKGGVYENIFTALVRKDTSDSCLFFPLKLVDAFALVKTKVLNTCFTSQKNTDLRYFPPFS